MVMKILEYFNQQLQRFLFFCNSADNVTRIDTFTGNYFLIYFIGSAYPDYFDVDKFSKSFMKTDNIDFRDNIIYALDVLISMVFVAKRFVV